MKSYPVEIQLSVTLLAFHSSPVAYDWLRYNPSTQLTHTQSICEASHFVAITGMSTLLGRDRAVTSLWRFIGVKSTWLKSHHIICKRRCNPSTQLTHTQSIFEASHFVAITLHRYNCQYLISNDHLHITVVTLLWRYSAVRSSVKRTSLQTCQ